MNYFLCVSHSPVTEEVWGTVLNISRHSCNRSIATVLGHAERREPFHYCTGPPLPGERKSVEPVAEQAVPNRVRSKHQSLHHFVADALWLAAALLGAGRDASICSIGFGAPPQGCAD